MVVVGVGMGKSGISDSVTGSSSGAAVASSAAAGPPSSSSVAVGATFPYVNSNAFLTSV